MAGAHHRDCACHKQEKQVAWKKSDKREDHVGG